MHVSSDVKHKLPYVMRHWHPIASDQAVNHWANTKLIESTKAVNDEIMSCTEQFAKYAPVCHIWLRIAYV